jgi:hypothetical protein
MAILAVEGQNRARRWTVKKLKYREEQVAYTLLQAECAASVANVRRQIRINNATS